MVLHEWAESLKSTSNKQVKNGLEWICCHRTSVSLKSSLISVVHIQLLHARLIRGIWWIALWITISSPSWILINEFQCVFVKPAHISFNEMWRNSFCRSGFSQILFLFASLASLSLPSSLLCASQITLFNYGIDNRIKEMHQSNEKKSFSLWRACSAQIIQHFFVGDFSLPIFSLSSNTDRKKLSGFSHLWWALYDSWMNPDNKANEVHEGKSDDFEHTRETQYTHTPTERETWEQCIKVFALSSECVRMCLCMRKVMRVKAKKKYLTHKKKLNALHTDFAVVCVVVRFILVIHNCKYYTICCCWPYPLENQRDFLFFYLTSFLRTSLFVHMQVDV